MNDLINSDEKINLYELLEIDSNSSKKEIKNAWKKLALKYHPDKNNNNTSEKFIKIKYAYEILSNDELKNQYDKKFKLKTNKIFDILNFKDNIINFFNSTEMEKILKLMTKKKDIISNFFNISVELNNFDNFIKKITDIIIIIDFDLRDVWLCNPKIIKYQRYTKNIFEELIYPIDFEQIYEGEGDEIIINNIMYKGNLTVKINIINTFYFGENYYILDDELYVLINKTRINNNKFQLNFLDEKKYKFNITKLKNQNKKVGNVYFKKKFGFPKYISNNITEINQKNINNTIIDIETNITYSNLFFIILL
jgi:DnaJ-class molecular chaperone